MWCLMRTCSCFWITYWWSSILIRNIKTKHILDFQYVMEGILCDFSSYFYTFNTLIINYWRSTEYFWLWFSEIWINLIKWWKYNTWYSRCNYTWDNFWTDGCVIYLLFYLVRDLQEKIRQYTCQEGNRVLIICFRYFVLLLCSNSSTKGRLCGNSEKWYNLRISIYLLWRILQSTCYFNL